MPTTHQSPPPPEKPPVWATQQAMSDLPVGSETLAVAALAWDLADAAAERLDERHDGGLVRPVVRRTGNRDCGGRSPGDPRRYNSAGAGKNG